jgi:lysophospholipase L1-like esterase
MKRLKIVAFGDSMTQAMQVAPGKRWPAMLERRLGKALAPRKVTVINAGVGGNTSREGLRRIEKDVLAHRPGWILVEFGGNDATIEPARHVPIKEFNKNLQKICEKASAIKARVALINFPPVVDAWHGWITKEETRKQFNSAGGLDAAIHPYRRAVESCAREHQCLFIDWYHHIRTAMERDGYGVYILKDGVHFTKKGNRLAFEIVFQSLRIMLLKSGL